MTDAENKSEPSSSNKDEGEILKQQNHALHERLDKAQAENTRYKQRLEQLAHALQERDRRIAELQLFEYRLKKTSEKSLDLEERLVNSQSIIKKIQDEKEAVELALGDSQQHTKQLDRVIQFLRERAETGRLELKQIQTEISASQDIVAQLSQKIEEFSAEHDSLLYHIKYEQALKQEVQDELSAIQKQWGQLQHAVRNTQQQNAQSALVISSLREEKQQLEMALLAKEDAIAACKQQLQGMHKLQQRYNIAVDSNISASLQAIRMKEEFLIQENEIEELYNRQKAYRSEISSLLQHQHRYENSLAEARALQAEKEAEIRIAQQHLGKRVKEATLLSEKNEALRNEIVELQKAASERHFEMLEVQRSLEKQLQHERKLQEQHTENLKSSAATIAEWEAKYLQLYNKWQEADARNIALKSIEEKHLQMQALLNNFSALTNAVNHPSGSHPQPDLPVTEIARPTVQEIIERHERFEQLRQPAGLNSEGEQLFEAPKPSIRFKQNLFD